MSNMLPLATRLRPRSLAEVRGQSHLLGENKPLRLALEHHSLHSFILWGPPGVGKTTVAKLFADDVGAHFVSLSAVLSGVKEIREVIDHAARSMLPTILFVDEIHRFNKAQQDAFLPYIEEGVITLIGATTENPSFELNNALLSRTRVYVLKSLTEAELLAILQQALEDERGYAHLRFEFPEDLQRQLVLAADGDARQVLNLLEILVDFSDPQDHVCRIEAERVAAVLSHHQKRFDQGGDLFHEQISALHKSVRGSDPDAALYWFCRMIDGGCDPRYIARRIIRMASEDIGNADPRALPLALAAAETYERLGSPEGELALAQALLYLACAAKSNAVYLAYGKAMDTVKATATLPVPLHLRNAPTRLMKELGYAKQYRYAHDEPHAYAAGENYFPEGLPPQTFYEPTDRGLEQKIREKLAFLRSLK